MNQAEIRKTLETFRPDGSLIEIRAVSGRTLSGYFKDVESLLRAISAHPQETYYFVMNEIKDACYNRDQREKLVAKPKATTSDGDIERRQWILVDCDPVRVSGTSSTNEEKAKSKATMTTTYNYLNAQGFSKPIIADSGNGYHLLYKISMANTDETKELIKAFLAALDMMFSDEHVSIDTAVFNASRITKLYGVITQKGANTPERPHRMSRVLRVPDEVSPTSIELVQKVAAIIPKPDKPTYSNGYGQNRFDLRNFIGKHGINVKSEKSYNGGTKYVLESCLFDSSHKAPDAAIIQQSDGSLGYHCFHNSCQQ